MGDEKKETTDETKILTKVDNPQATLDVQYKPCPRNKVWENKKVKDDHIEGCPVYGDAIVYIRGEVMGKALCLAREMKIEWLGYLIGEMINPLEYWVMDIYIPKQTGSWARCENHEPEPPGTVGIIHSHNSMGAHMSGIDENSINIQNAVSIVINSRGEVEGVICIRLPCGKTTNIKARVVSVMENFPEWLKEQIVKIEDDTKTPSTYQYQGNQYYDKHNGKILNRVYDPETGTWIDTWVDPTGGFDDIDDVSPKYKKKKKGKKDKEDDPREGDEYFRNGCDFIGI